MALQILENNGTFHLKGNLNATTSRFLIIYFEHIIKEFKNITISIENVKEIDANGVRAFNTLYANALRMQKVFYVVGRGSKDLYDEFNYRQVA